MGQYNGGAVATSPRERLLERLEDERTVAALEGLLDQAELLAFSVRALDGLLRRGDELAGNLGQGLAELRQFSPDGAGGPSAIEQVPRLARAGARLAEVAERPAVQRLLDSGLLEELGKPQTIAALQSLLQHVELLAFAGQALDGFVRRGDAVVEAVAESVGDLRTVTRDSALADALPSLQRVAKLALERHTLEAIVKLADAGLPVVDSGLFEPELVASVADAGTTLAESYEEARQSKPRPIGPLDLFRVLRDPDVQRSLGFAVAVARNFGRRTRDGVPTKEMRTHA
jgi:uncharacterized protein YjgD (DUF1641 family)